MDETILKPVPLVLVVHTAVDYLRRQGAGVGIVQQAKCLATDTINHQLIPDQERKYGIKGENLAVENVKTAERAEMLALLHALGLARGTVKRSSQRAVELKRVAVFSESLEVVGKINHHLKYAPHSLQDVASANDRAIIKRVIAGVRKLSRHGLEVTIATSSENSKARDRARTLARQKGRQACKSRRRLQLAQANSIEGQGDGAGDHLTIMLVIRTKESTEETEH